MVKIVYTTMNCPTCNAPVSPNNSRLNGARINRIASLGAELARLDLSKKVGLHKKNEILVELSSLGACVDDDGFIITNKL